MSRKSRSFSPTPGYYHVTDSQWGKPLDLTLEPDDRAYGPMFRIARSNGDPLAHIDHCSVRTAYETRCNAMLMAGAPELLNALVIAHNRLDSVIGAKDLESARRHAIKTQGGIRGGLAKVVGPYDGIYNIAGHTLIKPERTE